MWIVECGRCKGGMCVLFFTRYEVKIQPICRLLPSNNRHVQWIAFSLLHFRVTMYSNLSNFHTVRLKCLLISLIYDRYTHVVVEIWEAPCRCDPRFGDSLDPTPAVFTRLSCQPACRAFHPVWPPSLPQPTPCAIDSRRFPLVTGRLSGSDWSARVIRLDMCVYELGQRVLTMKAKCVR